MLTNHLILATPFSSCPQFFPASQSFPMSQLFTSGGQIIWSFSISPSNEYSGLISFMIDWFDLLAVQGTLKNLLQHHNSKASILRHSAFFMVRLSHPYLTTGKTVSLTKQAYSIVTHRRCSVMLLFPPFSTGPCHQLLICFLIYHQSWYLVPGFCIKSKQTKRWQQISKIVLG